MSSSQLPMDGLSAATSEPPKARPQLSSMLELQAILENATVGILFTRNRCLIQANPLCAAMFGYSLEEFLRLSGRELYFSDAIYERLNEEVGPVLASGQAYRNEVQMRRKDGSAFFCRFSAKAMDAQRPHNGTIWIMEDVSEDRAMRDVLQQSLRELTSIFETALVGIAVVRHHKVIRCNQRFEELLGFDAGEMRGRSMRGVFVDAASYEVARLCVGGPAEPSRSEQRLRRRRGEVFCAYVSCRPFDENDDEAGAVWVVEDISEQKAAQASVREAQDELEQRIVERTSALAQANEQLKEEIYERMQAEQRIWHVAHHDDLTGLPNRALLHDRLERSIVQAERHKQRIAVLFLDLDRFKTINDTLGHDVGDELLKEVAERLRSAVRAMDTVSRLGGDEFVIVLPEIDAVDDAMLVAQKLIEALAPVIPIGSNALNVTPSVGISIYPDDGLDAYTLMKNADTAMYHAKAEGRNNFQFFTARMTEEAMRIFQLENRMRIGIEQNEFVLHYQPVIDYRRRAVAGLEALIRWDDKEKGLIAPAEFIPVAEETGLIVPLGDWVIHESLRQNRLWQEQGHPLVPVAVNLSARQFRHGGLLDNVRAMLADTGQPARLLELEITESTLMHDIAEAQEKLNELAAMGISLSIDDFGTGYSSLSYLKRFPVHKLKVDRSFVRDICTDRDDEAITVAILSLARSLGLDTVAEGLETQEQLQILLSHGCTKFQGYYFSRPLPAAQAEVLFSSHTAGNSL